MKRVLIMEDNIDLAINWKNAFELNGCKVTISHDGDEASTFLEKEEFDLVVTDMFVPHKRGGLHVLFTLFKMGKKAPPAIAVTGERISSRKNEDVNMFLRQAERLGASSHIQKPFPPAELVVLAQSFWDKEDQQ